MKSYTELVRRTSFEERFRYLQLHGRIGADTFGFDRYMNQKFYQSGEWRQFRDKVILRDNGCDLGCAERPILDCVIREGRVIRPKIIIHHINPLTREDILEHSRALFDMDNVICVSDRTHKAIHYGDEALLERSEEERKPGDTCPWRR